MSRSQKRIVRATVQKIKTPEGIQKFIHNAGQQSSTSVVKQIVKEHSQVEEYHYTWQSNFEPVQFDHSVNTIKKCFWAQASIEFPRNKRTDAEGNILPRDERINISDVPVILVVDSAEEAFMIIISSYGPDIGRVDQLIGRDKVIELGDAELITNEFFVWMYYCYNKNEEILTDLKLNNITGFTGIIADDTNRITGSSDSTSDLLITKAFVSNGYDLKSLRFDLTDNVLTTITAINEDRSLIMDLNETKLYFDGLSEEDKFQIMIRAVSYIYSGLLPALLAKYDSKKESFEGQNKNFSKEIGIEVVQAIISKNGIMIDDINFD
ncbi:MAG: hypothetical protein ABF991_03155 [Liquorilactobacillus hordei]|uniref:hypothetical protein n=1 Tax=Liquorilactobacillus hordei TaxID=468911 RepID=UPI0039E90A09